MATPTPTRYNVPHGATCYGGKSAPVGPPSWVPPVGYFADVPMQNYAQDATPAPYQPGDAEAVFSRWTGGCVLEDYSALGALVYIGAGHSPNQPDIRFTPICDFSTLRWYSANALTDLSHIPDAAGALDTSTGLYVVDAAPNTMPMNPHTYLGVQAVPAAWGGGPKGSVFQFAYAGSDCQNRINIFDVSKATYGHHQMVTSCPQSASPDRVKFFAGAGNETSSYPISCRDDKRQGWWLATNGAHDYTLFVDKNGNITQYPSMTGGYSSWGSMTHIKSKDLLVFFDGGTPGATKLYVRDLATGQTAQVPLNGPAICINLNNQCRVEIAGLQWVEELGLIAGIDCQNDTKPSSLFVTVTPPATNPLVNAWTVNQVPLQHWDAGDPNGSKTIRDAANGNFSKFQWVPALHAFVLASSSSVKPQVFRI